MPFIQRIVDPVNVSGVKVDKKVSNELECVTNHTLANVIRQLSSLSKHAEDMFSELYRETTTFFQRASDLNSRVEHLRVKVTQLNPTEEVVQLQDIHLRKPYRSSNQHDQQVVSRITMPQAIQDMYIVCEKPPSLDKLNKYREDGKDCMKFYTDPSYFFELWFTEIKKDIDKQKKELKMKKGKKHRSPPSNKQVKPKEIVTKAKKYQDKSMGREFESDYQVPNIRAGGNEPVPQGYQKVSSSNRPESLEGYSRQSQDLPQTNDMGNHIDTRQLNGPISEHYQVQPPNDYSKNQRQSQRIQQNAQNQNQSPKDRRTNYSSQNIQSPSRPNMAPPPPPPGINQHRGSSMSPQRESLPPPPPPPPLEDSPGHHQHTPQMGRYPQHLHNMPGQGSSPHGSPIHQQLMRDHELPPPPPPPPMAETPDTPEMPPPPSPPSVMDKSPPPPPPPPPPKALPPATMTAPAPPPPPPFNGHLRNQADTMSVSSESSSTTYSSTKEVEPPPVPEPEKHTGRNALLEEIRLGNKKLKKTEERKRETAPKDKFDVHAVMTRAFDMRRRAMEDSESDDDDEDEKDWDDEDT